MTLEEIQNEVLRKIGRNVLNFQKLELLLKEIIAGSHLQGQPRDLKCRLKTRRNDVSMKTMGSLASEFTDTVYNTRSPDSSPPDETNPWISISFRLEVDESHVSERRKSLARIVEARNKLIHQLLPAYDHSSITGCESMLKLLEEQHFNLMPEYEQVRTIYGAMVELRNDAITHFLASIDSGQID